MSTLTHVISLRPDLRKNKKAHGPLAMLYCGVVIGSSRQPIYDAARYLLDSDRAEPGDRVETWRGEVLCMSGVAGDLAKRTVVENDHGNPAFQLRRWKAFSADTVAPRTAKSDFQADMDAEPMEAVL